MEKLKLNVEALEVESFDADGCETPPGTVHAREMATGLCTRYWTCPHTCEGRETCEAGVCY